MSESVFRMKRWIVSVVGYSPELLSAASRGKALADAWSSPAFHGKTFGEFLKMARCNRSAVVPARWGDTITIEGRPAHFLGENGQYVQFVWPGEGVVLNSHPLDVEPPGYRPAAYRSPLTPPDPPAPTPDQAHRPHAPRTARASDR